MMIIVIYDLYILKCSISTHSCAAYMYIAALCSSDIRQVATSDAVTVQTFTANPLVAVTFHSLLGLAVSAASWLITMLPFISLGLHLEPS